MRSELSSYDPYDVWKTAAGFRAKKLYNRAPRIGLPLVALFSVFDHLNQRSRWFYQPVEHPAARAMAALCLLNLYRADHEPRYLAQAELHLEWLLAHSCTGYSGPCWGLGFPHAVSKNVVYDSNTPFSTITPYALEAFVAFSEVTGDRRYHPVIRGIFQFFDADLQVMEKDGEATATSYGPFPDRIVLNAITYTMYAHAVAVPYLTHVDQERSRDKVRRLFNYVRRQQQPDGSWFYSPEGRSFIDCFHTCITLKNIVKTTRMIRLEKADQTVSAGYRYLRERFLDHSRMLFRRFSIRNKPGLIRFDLYDNAEALNLALLLGETRLAEDLCNSIVQNFCDGFDIYSQIDFLGFRKNKNTLRWAVLPFLSAATAAIAPERSWKQLSTHVS